MNLAPTVMPSRAEYDAAFATERAKDYPEIDAFERVCGYAVNRDRLEAAARVLACPVKKSPPNWQHGRVLYAAMREYLVDHPGPVLCFDCGTAKGFSALVAQWALNDSDTSGEVHSVDVINPTEAVFRNSVRDLDGPCRLADYHEPWPEASAIRFYKLTGFEWLCSDTDRVNVAFIDGKHSTESVTAEGRRLALRQEPGDLALFDDVQIPAVAEAIDRLDKFYAFTGITLSAAKRTYALGVRR
jgi:hypothetical protein